MARISIIFGILLILVGGAGYGMSAQANWIALIPSLLGLALVACAVIDLLSEVAGTMLGVVVALAGIGGTFINVMQLGSLFAGTAANPAVVVTSTITFILLIAYAVFAVRSLIGATQNYRHPAKTV